MHVAIYNTKLGKVELEEEIAEDAMLPIMAMVGGKEVQTGEVSELAHRLQVLALECMNRGTLDGEWKVYQNEKEFDWKEVESA